MSRRPLLHPIGDMAKAHDRMAPGGMLWSESPIPRGYRPRVPVLGDEPPPAPFTYRIGAGIGDAWSGFWLNLGPPYDPPPLGGTAVFTMLPPESGLWPDTDPVTVYCVREDPDTLVTTTVATLTVSAGSPVSAPHTLPAAPNIKYQVNLGTGTTGATRTGLWTGGYDWPDTEQTFAEVTA